MRLRLCSMLLSAAALALPVSSLANSPIKRVEPVYPAEAARAGTSGFVELEYSIGADGKVTDVSVVDAKPGRIFVPAAVKAVKQWVFAPGEGRGKVKLEFKQ